MTQQISVQKVVSPDHFSLVGTETSSSLVLVSPLTLNYTDGSSDTLPTGTAAVLPDNSTTFNRQQMVWVAYAKKGEGILRIIGEAMLPLLAGDYAPLVRILKDDIVHYQPGQPAGAPDVSGAWSGGAFVGSGRSWTGGAQIGGYDTQSFVGGAALTASFTPFGVVLGIYARPVVLPSVSTALLEFSDGANHATICLNSDGSLSYNTNLLRTQSGTTAWAISAGQWVWVSLAGNCDGANSGSFYWTAGMFSGPNGAGFGSGFGLSPPYYPGAALYTAAFGVSPSGYAANAPTRNFNLSKGYLDIGGEGHNNPYAGPPTSDWPPQGTSVRVYNCRQTLGTATALTDTSGNAVNMPAGPQGITIAQAGPYP